MPIERISVIKNHRIFHDFTWPADLNSFASKNLIYGWNGTGKSTLSNIFRALEKREAITEGNIEFLINGRRVFGARLHEMQELPIIRVFNQDFIADNVFTKSGSPKPIFVLGADNIEKSNRADKLTEQKVELENEATAENRDLITLKSNFERYKSTCAKEIKDKLTGSGVNTFYNTYDKSNFQKKCEELLLLSEVDLNAKILNDEDYYTIKEKTKNDPKDFLEELGFKWPSIANLNNKIVSTLTKTVTSSVIDTLKEDPELAAWVREGLAMHKHKNSHNCLFCEQELPAQRISCLESHFNDQYNSFISEIDGLIRHIENINQSLQSCNPSPKTHFYQELHEIYETKCSELVKIIDTLKAHLQFLKDALIEKRNLPFQSLHKTFESVELNQGIIEDINAIIKRHNSTTENFESESNIAQQRIEESIVAKCIQEFEKQKNAIKELTDKTKEKSTQIEELNSQISALLQEAVNHRISADQLNHDIEAYLGRDELKFVAHDEGYQIKRHDKIARNLSEGEKTAIAFLYFLKTLQGQDFKLGDGVVVIDDPISSLDTNSLFSAFGFMKHRCEEAGQLFILTHSHAFFRQVRSWLKTKNETAAKKEPPVIPPAHFYMLQSGVCDTSRTSSITPLDSLLLKYESEYVYLFSIIHAAANSPTSGDLQKYYYLPNVCRRLLECFFAFRYPTSANNFTSSLHRTGIDEGQRIRIERFAQTFSHAQQVSESEHDPSILCEAKSIAQEIINLLEVEDPKHFEGLKKVLERANSSPL